MENFKLFATITLLSGIAFSGCSSSAVRVQTTPEGAQVDLLREDGGAMKLGITPLSLTKDQSPDLFRNNSEIRISKDGYQTSEILVPYSSFGQDSKINIALQDAKLPSSCSNQDANLNELGQKIAEAQRLIYKKDFAESIRILRSLAERFPTVSIVYSLLGNGFYLEKNYPEALTAFRKAQQLNPSDKSIAHIIEKLGPVTGNDHGNSSGGNTQ